MFLFHNGTHSMPFYSITMAMREAAHADVQFVGLFAISATEENDATNGS